MDRRRGREGARRRQALRHRPRPMIDMGVGEDQVLERVTRTIVEHLRPRRIGSSAAARVGPPRPTATTTSWSRWRPTCRTASGGARSTISFRSTGPSTTGRWTSTSTRRRSCGDGRTTSDSSSMTLSARDASCIAGRMSPTGCGKAAQCVSRRSMGASAQDARSCQAPRCLPPRRCRPAGSARFLQPAPRALSPQPLSKGARADHVRRQNRDRGGDHAARRGAADAGAAAATLGREVAVGPEA
jgi:hypothetical protein